MQIADNGTIWFAVYDDSRIGKVRRPESETFKDSRCRTADETYAPRARKPTVRSVSSYYRDVMGQARSGQRQGDRISDAYVDNGMRDFFVEQGRQDVVCDAAEQQVATSMSPTAASGRGALSG